MKRDMDLIRSILMLVGDQTPGEIVRDFSPLQAENQLVIEHVWLAKKAGLVEGTFAGDSPSHGAAVIFRLTPVGHDFLAQARQPVLWNKTKETAEKAGVGLTIEVLKPILTHLATAAIASVLR